MKRFKVVARIGCMPLVGTMLARIARADDWNRKTVITFSAPVEIPGVHLAGWGVLPAGAYVFKIMDSQSDCHIAQISNKDETTIHATILAIPNYRLKANDKDGDHVPGRTGGTAGSPAGVVLSRQELGRRIRISEGKAVALAKAANAPVLFTPFEMPIELAEPIKSAADPVVLELKRAPVLAVTPTGEEVQLTQVVGYATPGAD